jgi:hypothetical protein
MSDTDTLAEAPVVNDTQPVSDGIIDLDAQEAVEVKTDEDGEPKVGPENTGDKDAGEEAKKKLSGAQRAKVREARLLNEIAARDRELEALRTKAPATTAGDEDKPPREEDFNGDYFAFQSAKTAYEAGKAAAAAVDKRLGVREESERNERQAKIATERKLAHLERVEDAREVIADFDQVMKGMDGVQVRNDVIEEIMSSDNSAAISYHLAKNPDKLNAMNSMSSRELAREMGRLEATVKLPEAKKATDAPAPLSRSKGGASPSSAESDLNNWLKKTYGK